MNMNHRMENAPPTLRRTRRAVTLLWRVSFPLVVTKLGNEKRNQIDKIHVLAWEKEVTTTEFEKVTLLLKVTWFFQRKETVIGNFPNWMEWSLHGQDCQIERKGIVSYMYLKHSTNTLVIN